MNELINYGLAALATGGSAILAWLLYRTRYRDKQIDVLEARVTDLEIRTNKDFAVIDVKLEAIREDTRNIREMVRKRD